MGRRQPIIWNEIYKNHLPIRTQLKNVESLKGQRQPFHTIYTKYFCMYENGLGKKIESGCQTEKTLDSSTTKMQYKKLIAT